MLATARPSCSGFSRDIAIAANFGRNLQNDLHLTGWRFETNRNMAVLIQKYSVTILCKFHPDRSSNLRDYEGNNYTFLEET